ncbi:hypothetical protein VB735_31215 [Halotia wernerae UHCC 0503]|nr:hypothetical protein [Halotia wernerae UHCC 0503]
MAVPKVRCSVGFKSEACVEQMKTGNPQVESTQIVPEPQSGSTRADKNQSKPESTTTSLAQNPAQNYPKTLSKLSKNARLTDLAIQFRKNSTNAPEKLYKKGTILEIKANLEKINKENNNNYELIISDEIDKNSKHYSPIPKDNKISAICILEKEENNEIKELDLQNRQGESISIRGKLDIYKRYHIQLNDCVLVS